MSDDEDKLLRLLVGKYIKKGKPKGSKVHDTSRMLAQLAFWCDMREALAANEATMGLEILDDVAEVILDELGKANEALSGTVTAVQESGGSEPSTLHQLHAGESEVAALVGKEPPVPRQETQSILGREGGELLHERFGREGPAADSYRPRQAVRARVQAQCVALRTGIPPWKGSRLFYDPALYPHVHVGH
ncbi:hypothetical protein PF007_g11061 [Phytophthora fragariae]|uniref:Uncharacterized protein n=1 Tax=Phytophthora fragariae TaxID=53985 RepID=A0A6A3SAB8_9STRA|nr:hypothetical protein PF003_g15815 [Phytophthora fragariae]KAE8930231.1 hypothetical protein PF009_g19667 [Phytophthora fragariae]KAE9112151.1 hypothetical protein PF006_g20048 [Phytophthora fragariae]KAE9112519.1 hypothetical protein PF007_g11061 [Phytophthora fragariae]